MNYPVLALLTCLLLTLQPASQLKACCPAFPRGAEVKIADQEVLIVWNPETQTEHFIRSAAFQTEEKGFGFLVPTPRQPSVKEAESSVFHWLADAIRPEVIPVNRYRPALMSACIAILAPKTLGVKSSKSVPDTVRVLERTVVAGYDVAVLEADDAGALTAWLKDNGYSSRPALTEWAEPYVAAGWKISAFKYAEGKAIRRSSQVGTKAVRLSFKTDRPLFPYRVPNDQLAPAGGGNLLRLYFLSNARFKAGLGDEENPWSAKTKFAAPLGRDSALPLQDTITLGKLSPKPWLTAFEDSTWPSGTEDLYFSPAEQVEYYPSPVEIDVDRQIPIPLEIVFAFLLAGGIYVYKRKKQPTSA